MAEAAAHSPPETRKPLPLPDKPSIAVLPFQNMSGDPEQEYFADGMVEDIITALSRFKSLVRHRSEFEFCVQGKSRRHQASGHEIWGSLRARRERTSISRKAGLSRVVIETTTGSHIWADRWIMRAC